MLITVLLLMGACLAEQRRYLEAVEFFEKACALFEVSLPAEHHSRANGRHIESLVFGFFGRS